MKFAAFDLAKRDQRAVGRHGDRTLEGRGIPSAQQHRLPIEQPSRLRPIDGERRDVVQRRLDRKESVSEPLSGVMKPKPFSSLNHLTVPL